MSTTTAIPTAHEVGQRLRTVAYIIGRIVAFLYVAAEATYSAGYRTGQFVHSLNDRLVGVVGKFGPVPTDGELVQLWGAEAFTSDGLDALIDAWEQADPERAAMPDHIYGYVSAEGAGEQPAVK